MPYYRLSPDHLGVMPMAFDAAISDRIAVTRAVVATRAQATTTPETYRPSIVDAFVRVPAVVERERLLRLEADAQRRAHRAGIPDPHLVTPTKKLISSASLNNMKFMYMTRPIVRPGMTKILINEVVDGERIVASWDAALAEQKADAVIDAGIKNGIQQAGAGSFFEGEFFQEYGLYAVLALGGWIVYDAFIKKSRPARKIGFARTGR